MTYRDERPSFIKWLTNPSTLFVLISFIVIIFFSLRADLQTTQKVKEENLKNTCYANQRILSAAIELYNMDHKIMIESYTRETMWILVEEKYLREALELSADCRYSSSGNLAEDGIISCEVHGSIL